MFDFAKVKFVVVTADSWLVFDSWLQLEMDWEDVVQMDYELQKKKEENFKRSAISDGNKKLIHKNNSNCMR